MKKTLRALLCVLALAASLCLPAFAASAAPAGVTLPEKQGDFYLMMNGEFVTSFTDALPRAKDNRSFLPFRHTFELLGFDDIQWNQETSTASATRADGTSVAVKLGEQALTITENGKSRVVETDTAAFADMKLQRTFVPIGLIARALDNYNVGWDATNGVAILDDVDRIVAANQETFTLMDQLMDYSRAFETGKWKQTGSCDAKLGLSSSASESPMEFTMTADGDYASLVMDNRAFQLTGNLKVDASFLMDGQDMVETLGQIPGSGMPEMPVDVDLDMRGDQSTGAFYFHSKGLTDLMNIGETEKKEDAWYKIDMASLWDSSFSETGLTWSQLMEIGQSDASFEEQLPRILHSIPVESMYATTTDYLDAIALTLGDRAFEKQNDTWVNDMSEALDGAGTMKITLYTAGGKVNGVGMEMKVNASEEDTALGMSLDLTQKDMALDASMTMDMDTGTGDDAMSFSFAFDMDGTMATTTETPETEPPAGANVEDMTSSDLIPDMGLIGGADGPTAWLPS